jgi:hypothetical protein
MLGLALHTANHHAGAQGGIMSKLPVRAPAKATFSPKTERLLTLTQALFPIAVSVGTAIWAINGYFDQQKASLGQEKMAQAARANEARKPFYEKQLTLYFETAKVAGMLVTEDPASPAWDALKRRFYALYWSELSMVEDASVERSMINFETTLTNFNKDNSLGAEVQRQAYCLSHALKESIARNWTIDFHVDHGTHIAGSPVRLVTGHCYEKVERK